MISLRVGPPPPEIILHSHKHVRLLALTIKSG